MTKSTNFFKSFLLPTLLFTISFLVEAQTTTFTYQGRLTDNSFDAQGTYQMQFSLFDAVSSGSQIGSTITNTSVNVVNGVFTVQLDFGASAFSGSVRFIEVAVCKAPCSTYTTLTPRQQVTSAPYSIQSLNATTATNSTQLGGIAASQYIQEGDSRLTDARTPTAGSANYIQNTTTQQATSNFNISGTGTANIFSATTQYNIGTNRVLSIGGTSNLYVGVGAGNNTTGVSNSFFGQSAGSANTTGVQNSFFGRQAGLLNTTGEANSFFGRQAGFLSTTANDNSFFGVSAGQNNRTGNSNSFFGRSAGSANTTGNNNSSFGRGASLASGDLNYATAIGSDAIVNASNRIQLGRFGRDVVRIGTTGSGGTLQLCLNGSFVISTCSSSVRYKSYIKNFNFGLNLIKKLRPVTFNWTDGGILDFGLVAEEVEKVEPLLTTTNKDGKVEGVKYDRIGVVLINAVKEQQNQIENLKTENKQIKFDNKKLKTKIKKQEVIIHGLLKLVCGDKPNSKICKEIK